MDTVYRTGYHCSLPQVVLTLSWQYHNFYQLILAKGSSELYQSYFVYCRRSLLLTFHIFDISSDSSGPILTKLCMHDPQDKGFQSCTIGGPHKGQVKLKKSSSPKLQCRKLNRLDIQTPQDMQYQSYTNLKDPLKKRLISGPILIKLVIHDPYDYDIDTMQLYGLACWATQGSTRAQKHVKIHIFDISSESSGPILTKLCMHDPQEQGFQSC